MVRKVLIAAIGVLVVIGLGVVGIMWWTARPGTPDLPSDLEALRPEAVSVGEMRPTDIGGGWMMAVSQVETSGASVRIWPGDESAPGAGAAMEVGTSTVIGPCTVALLETRPGRASGGDGGQTGSVLVHVACEPLPSAPAEDDGHAEG